MEELKWKFFHRLFRPKQPNGVELDPAMKAMEDWSRMLVGATGTMLNNIKLFELTKRSEESSTCLEQLALCFFNPLLQSQRGVRAVNAQGIQNRLHFLDLFRHSILPFPINLSQGLKTSKTSDSSNAAEEGIDMVRSMTELMEAGVVIEKAVNCPPLDVSSEGRWLKVPPLYIDDHKGTLFRNMVAYEQCHPKCKPYVTSYLFFFDGLVNSAEDEGFIHHKGVLPHCLGSNKEVAKLLNGLCKEIAMDGRESYLCKVVHDMNTYCNGSYAWFRAGLDSNDELRDAESAWLCVKHVKSNAIVTSKVRQPLGQPREVCESGIGVIAERLSRPGGSIREMEMPSTVYSK
ncbi:hypothetical protein GOBAR_DD27858 [Gossypium barbadense]|nr:hypothetical protein GOBAR_DD27858 [Gossypium barbadense]